jgi:hypothetical protein
MKVSNLNHKTCKAITVLVSVILFGCTKATDTVDLAAYEGKWNGSMYYDLDGSPVSISTATRTINGSTSLWFTKSIKSSAGIWDYDVPICESDFFPAEGQYAINAVLTDSAAVDLTDENLCNDKPQHWIIQWIGSGYLKNNALFETGAVTYKLYYDGLLIADKKGNWTAEFTKMQ